MKSFSKRSVLPGAVLSVFFGISLSAAGTVLEVNVPDGDTQTGFTDDQLTAIEGLGENDEINKTGGGTLALTATTKISTFKGTIRISNGIYQVAGGAGFLGTTNGPTIVESGATLKFIGYVASGYYKGEDLRIAGTGYGSEGGAIVGNATDNVNLRNLTLTADATTCAPGANNVSFFGALSLNGYTLTLHMKGTGGSKVQPTSVVTPGHLVFKGNGTARDVEVPQSRDFPGGPEYTITFTDGSYPRFYEYVHTNRVYWTLRPRTAGSYALRINKNADLPTAAYWYGPIELPASGTYTLKATTHELHICGPITGGANINVETSSDGLLFLHGTNTYTGTLKATAGRVVAMHEDALPGWNAGQLTGTKSSSNPGYGVYLVSTNATRTLGWSPKRIGEVARYLRTAGKWNLCLYAAEGEETICELPAFDPADVNYNDQYVFTSGKGRHVIKGDYPDAFRIYTPYTPSDIIYSSKDPATAAFKLGQFVINGTSTVTFENMGYAEITSYPYIGSSLSECATFVVGTNTVLGIGTGGKGLYVGNGKNRRGAAWILPGAVVSNGAWVATADVYTNNCGMVVQKGGLAHFASNGTSLGNAVNGLGYYELRDGRFASTAAITMAENNGGCGFFRQLGGEFEMLPGSQNFSIGGFGTGLVHVAGGSFKSARPLYAPKSIDASNRTAGYGRISVAGEARPRCEAGVFLGDRIDSKGWVDLTAGGVLETKAVTRCETTSKGGLSTGDSKAYVNFNGGGLCAISNGVELLGSGNAAVTRATVYAAGAILEAAEGISANVSVPLQAATGGGIASIALPAEAFDAHKCSPVVQIFGDGTGAAAVAEYDSDADVVTGITITSPGWGYTAENTTAVLHWSGNTILTNKALTVTVAENAGNGGVTKRGSGRIALAAANTYGGATVIESGTLAATVADAIPAGSAVTVKPGATLELASGVDYPADITADFESADPSVRYPLISCPEGTPAGEPAVKGLPAGWVMKLRGTAWIASYQRGAVFLVR